MVRYRRNFVPGGSYFFTVTLADRTSSALVHHVDALRMAFRIARHIDTNSTKSRPISVILRCPRKARASKDDRPGPSPFEARFARTSG